MSNARAFHDPLRQGAYSSWCAMRRRCNGQGHAVENKNYHERGITYCDRWVSFDAFFEDMGTRPEGMTLERNDNEGNYEPGNCRWLTHEQQHRNKRSNKLTIETVRYCRYMANLGLASHSALARVLNMSQPAMTRVINRERWSNLV